MSNKYAAGLLHELDFIDRNTFELKKDIQHKGCPFCDSENGEFVENYQTEQALFYKFKKCGSCSLIYPYPRPNRAVLRSFFTSDAYSQDSANRFARVLEKEASKNHFFGILDNWPLRYSYQEFRRFAKKGYRVLDIGAGHGIMAKELIKKGCIVEAVELNSYRAKYLRDKIGIKVYEKPFEEVSLPEASYDMIVFSQVLMHLFSLKEIMQKINYLLKPGGILVSSQMNFNSIVQKTIRAPYPGKNLTAFSICSWFTPESITNILERSGFKVIDMKFRPSGLFGYIFVDGYPGGYLTRLILRLIDQVLKVILMQTKTSDYFAVIAKKPH